MTYADYLLTGKVEDPQVKSKVPSGKIENSVDPVADDIKENVPPQDAHEIPLAPESHANSIVARPSGSDVTTPLRDSGLHTTHTDTTH